MQHKEAETLSASQSTPSAAPPARWLMLGVMLCIVTLSGMTQFIVAPISPFLQSAFSLSNSQLGVLSSATICGGIIGTLAFGIKADRSGVKRILLVGFLLLGGSLLLFFLPPRFVTTWALLFIAGIGLNGLTVMTHVGVVDWFPAHERGFAISLKQSGTTLGISAVAAILPSLAIGMGWNTAVGTLGIATLLLGAVLINLYRDGPYSQIAQTTGTAGADHEQQPAPSPLLLLRQPGFLILSAFGCAMNSTQTLVIFFLVPFLIERGGTTAVAAGAMLSVMQLFGTFSRPVAGLISDRLTGGRRKGVLIGIAVVGVVALTMLILLPQGLSNAVLFALMPIVGFGVSAWVGPFFALGVEQVPRALAGSANGFLITVNLTGGLLAPPLFGMIVDHSSFGIALSLTAVLLAMTTLVFYFRFRER